MFVSIYVFSLRMSKFVKAIHIKLSDEGGVVFVLVVSRKHLFCKFSDVSDIDGISFGSPLNDRFDGGIFHHIVKPIKELRNLFTFSLFAFSRHFYYYE